MNRYHINVFFSEEDDCYIADVPDLRFCTAHGATAGEAVAEVEKAMKAWLEVARQAGKPIPEPRYQAQSSGR